MTRPHGTLARYKRGCHCAPCRQANAAYKSHRARMIAYGRWEGLADPAGTRRRLQALVWNGWSLSLLSGRLGCDRTYLRKMLYGGGRVSAATVRRVAALYDELWKQPPPERDVPERGAATKARKYARERGWVPVGAWDDDPGPHCIDDPAATPAPSWDTEPAASRQRAEPPAVAAAIRRARERAEISQRALAAAVGVTESYIQLCEYGKRNPSAKTWQQLELVLGPLGVVRDGDPQRQRQGEAAA